MHLLPVTAVPEFFVKSSGSETVDGNVIDYAPYSNITEYNYNNGDLSVIYPVVEVWTADKDGNPVNGKEKYEFWTYDDKITIHDGALTHLVPVVEQKELYYSTGANGTDIDTIKQIWDHSAIVRMIKRMQLIDGSGKVTFDKRNTYAFSEELSCLAHVKTRYGVDRSSDNQSPTYSSKIDQNNQAEASQHCRYHSFQSFLLSTTQTVDGVTADEIRYV